MLVGEVMLMIHRRLDVRENGALVETDSRLPLKTQPPSSLIPNPNRVCYVWTRGIPRPR